MPKKPRQPVPPAEQRETLGVSPAVLAKREVKSKAWCAPEIREDIETDPWCLKNIPKTISYKSIVKAAAMMKHKIDKPPLIRSRHNKQFGMQLYFKPEIFHSTGSFCERTALYCLMRLNDEQRGRGVITASLGNWGLALAYHGQKLNIRVTIVIPKVALPIRAEKCRSFGAKVIIFGNNFAEAKSHAFQLIHQGNTSIYINGYDHPHAIAAAGTIGLEIMKELPETDAIIVPVGGGGLLSGIASAVKFLNTTVLIYGVEPKDNCGFFKAMENRGPYETEAQVGISGILGIPTAGYNAYHTAVSLVDKMILVDESQIYRAILHIVENEGMIVEGGGAVALSSLMNIPDVVPELKNKNIVCVLSGGNIDNATLTRSLDRGKSLDGRIVFFKIRLDADKSANEAKVLTLIGNLGVNILQCDVERRCIDPDNIYSVAVKLICETRNRNHSCQLKKVLNRLFPDTCEFYEEPFQPVSYCACFYMRP